MAERITPLDGQFTRNVLPPQRRSGELAALPGTAAGGPAAISFDGELLARNVLFLGAAGTGKSTTMIALLRQLRRQLGPEDVLCVFDTKGEFVQRLARPGDLILGKGAYPANCGWSLFRDATAGITCRKDLETRLHMIAKRLVPDKPNDSNRFFVLAAREALEGLLDTLLRHPEMLPGGKLTNGGLLAFLRQGNLDMLLDAARSEGLERLIGRKGRRDKTQNSVLLELQTNVRENLIGFSGEGDFSMLGFEQARGGRVLFLQYDLAAGGAADTCCGLLTDLYLTGFMSGSHRRGRLYLALDEVSLLGREAPENLIRAMNFGRGIGMGAVFLGAQSLAQLEELYGKGQLDALLAGCQTRICFRTEDEASRDFIKKDCGKVLCSTVRYIPGFSMTPGAPELKDAVSDTELTTLPRGCAIVSEPGEVPYRIQLDP